MDRMVKWPSSVTPMRSPRSFSCRQSVPGFKSRAGETNISRRCESSRCGSVMMCATHGSMHPATNHHHHNHSVTSRYIAAKKQPGCPGASHGTTKPNWESIAAPSRAWGGPHHNMNLGQQLGTATASTKGMLCLAQHGSPVTGSKGKAGCPKPPGQPSQLHTAGQQDSCCCSNLTLGLEQLHGATLD